MNEQGLSESKFSRNCSHRNSLICFLIVLLESEVCLVIVAAWLSRLFRARFSLLFRKSTLKVINFTVSMYSTL